MSSPVDIPLLSPKARLALAAFLVGGAVAGFTYRSWAMEHARAKPRLTPCFILALSAIQQPALESGTEPQETDTGETVYLAAKADKAVRCSTMMGDGTTTSRRLAGLLAEEDPEARAKRFMGIMSAIPNDESGDVDAAAFGMLTDAIMGAVPPSDTVYADRRRADDVATCRFNAPGCSKLVPMPIVTWISAGGGAVGLLGTLVGLGAGIVARRKAAPPKKPKKPKPEENAAAASSATEDVTAAEGESPPDAEARRKKKKKNKGSAGAAGTMSLLVLAFLLACQTPAKPAEPPPRAGPPPPASPPPEVTPPPPPAETPPPAASVEPPEASPGPTSQLMPREAPPNGACPGDMILVEGEYCTEVDHTCLRSWFDKSNKKEVCEEFAPKATCTGAKVKKRFCIDRFAWPNVRGERPEVMNNFYQAQVKCAAVEKRICTESEWTMSCEGPEMKPFPYGWKRDPTKCNGDHVWDEPHMKAVGKRDPTELARLWQGVPNGAQPECISDYGVPDLPGNTDDIASSETYSSRSKFDSTTTGGPWYKGTRNQCRPKIYTHDEGFYYYYLGFRCCGEADGKPTDPRTPKQRKDDWKFSRVEGLGRFTVAQMKEKLAQKKAGREGKGKGCACKDKDTLCKTMCGTLLGPNAKDADLKAPRQ